MTWCSESMKIGREIGKEMIISSLGNTFLNSYKTLAVSAVDFKDRGNQITGTCSF